MNSPFKTFDKRIAAIANNYYELKLQFKLKLDNTNAEV